MSYEFDADADQRLARVATRVLLWGTVSLGIGVLGLALAIASSTGMAFPLPVSTWRLLPLLCLQLVLGAFYVGAGRQLHAIVATQGHDIDHALHAIDHLTCALRLEALLTAPAMLAGFGVGALVFFDLQP